MRQNVNILWIDDEKDQRSEIADNLENSLHRLKIDNIHPKELSEKIEQYREDRRRNPDLFMVDHRLNQRADEDKKKYEGTSVSLFGKLREIDPEVPIYFVTGFQRSQDIISQKGVQVLETSFDGQYSIDEIQSSGEVLLYYGAQSYYKIKMESGKGIKGVFKLLRSSEMAQQLIKKVLPEVFRDGILSKRFPAGNSIAFAKWVKEILFKTPGILYNDLFVATHLGLNLRSFKKRVDRFDKARFNGVFYNTTINYWWMTDINDLLFSKKNIEEFPESNTWELGPLVFKIKKSEKSTCVVCGDNYPETVGENINIKKEYSPVHIRCSSIHPYKITSMYFDTPRSYELTKTPKR